MPRHVRFGLWYDFRNPDLPGGRVLSNEALYRANLEQIAWAEELGFESVWLTPDAAAHRGSRASGGGRGDGRDPE
jgi:hypothetical protein